MNILSFIEPIKEGVRKNSLILYVQVFDASFWKPYHDWLNKWSFYDMNQWEFMLEGW